MSQTETSAEVKAKILLDEANLAFSETSERKDASGDRKPDGSAWEEGRMEGEYDETDYQKILDLQMKAAIVCDEHPDLEEKTAKLFESINDSNAEGVLDTVRADKNIMVCLYKEYIGNICTRDFLNLIFDFFQGHNPASSLSRSVLPSFI